MPRTARIKNNKSVVYIVVKGISDVPLFRDDEDKITYLNLLKGNRDIFGFKLYAYCLMEGFAHFIIDLCGADISSIMSSVNVGYSGKYNRKYNRHGHVFYERFRSKIIKDELELKSITLYIHNSPTKLNGFEEHPEKYKYSSLGAYVGYKDSFDLVDDDFIINFIGKTPRARKQYLELISKFDCDKLMDELEFNSRISNSKFYTKKETPRIPPEEILDFVSKRTGISKLRLESKYVITSKDARAFIAFVLKNLYNYNNMEIGRILGFNSSVSITKLFYKGLELAEKDDEYKAMMEELKEKYS